MYLVATPSARTTTALGLCFVNSFGLSLAYQHISAFWADKAQVPMVKDYNEAILISNDMRQYLIGLGISWWAAAFYYTSRVLGLV